MRHSCERPRGGTDGICKDQTAGDAFLLRHAVADLHRAEPSPFLRNVDLLTDDALVQIAACQFLTTRDLEMKMASALSKHTSLPTLRNQVQSISPQVAGGSKKTRAEIRLNDCSHTYKTAIMTGDDTFTSCEQAISSKA